jgi:PIN domain nuclease of toxin-antitoxin system
MGAFVSRLPRLLIEQGGQAAVLSPQICLSAATLDWGHLDPFDRLIAATAINLGIPLISADRAYDDLNAETGWIAPIW